MGRPRGWRPDGRPAGRAGTPGPRWLPWSRCRDGATSRSAGCPLA